MAHAPSSRWIGLGVGIGTATLIGLLWMTPFGRWDARDATDFNAFYAPVAHNLREGAGLVTGRGEPAVRYPPGFPIILAGLYTGAQLTGTSEELWLRGFTMAGLALGTALLYRLAQLVLGARRALVAAVLWATYPFHLWFAVRPNSETLFVPLFLGALLLLQRARTESPNLRRVAAAGALVGCAALVRPIALLLPLVLGLLWVSQRRQARWRAAGEAALIMAAATLIVLPWEVTAYRMTGAWIPLSTAGVPAIRDGLTFAEVSNGYRRQLEAPPDVRTIGRVVLSEQRAGRLNTTGELASLLVQQARQRPGAVAKLYAWKAARAWYGTDAGHRAERYALLLQLFYVGASLIGIILLRREKGSGRMWVTTVVILVCYYWAMTIVSLSILRYMAPVMALLLTGAAVTITSASQRFAAVVAGSHARGLRTG